MTLLPSLDGLTFRRLDAPKDFIAMADLVNDSDRADEIEDYTTADAIAANYEHLVNSDPATDMVLAERDGRLVGYTRTQWWQEVEGPRIHLVYPFVHPSERTSPLTETLLDWSELRAREIASELGTGPAFYQSWVEQDRQRWLADEFDRRDYEVVTYGGFMVRRTLTEIPDADLPDGVEIRPVAEPHLRAIWEADVEAFRDHWGSAEPSEEQYRQFLAFPYRDESLWQVAWHGNEIVGQVRSFINPEENEEFGRARGYAEFISTARHWRKRGVATALICESLKALRERGMTEAGLGVHTENPTGAYSLYLGLGFELTETYLTYRKPIDLAA